jgi:hypothetical protein
MRWQRDSLARISRWYLPNASGYFVAEIGQFPQPGQDLVATQLQLAQPFGFLVHQLFSDGGAVPDHVGADAGLGFGVGGGFGIETDRFGGGRVRHSSVESRPPLASQHYEAVLAIGSQTAPPLSIKI